MFKKKTMAYVCERYLLDKQIQGVKPSTLSNYRTKIENHILPNFPVSIRKLNNETVYNFTQELIDKVSSKTLRDIIVLLNNILSFAFNNGYIRTQLKATCPSVQVKDIEIFTKGEQERLESYLMKHIDFFNFGIFLTLYTGIRIGELSALKFSDISGDLIYINKTLQRIPLLDAETKTQIVIDKPKTKKSVRKIPLHQKIIDYSQKLNFPDKESYILTGTSHYIEPRTVERKFKKILKKCAIEQKNFHLLRHTFATNCVKCGFEIKTLSEILGHSNIQITLNYYIHSDIDFKRVNIQKLEKE